MSFLFMVFLGTLHAENVLIVDHPAYPSADFAPNPVTTVVGSLRVVLRSQVVQTEQNGATTIQQPLLGARSGARCRDSGWASSRSSVAAGSSSTMPNRLRGNPANVAAGTSGRVPSSVCRGELWPRCAGRRGEPHRG